MILHRIFATSKQKTRPDVHLVRTDGRTAEDFATTLASFFVLGFGSGRKTQVTKVNNKNSNKKMKKFFIAFALAAVLLNGFFSALSSSSLPVSELNVEDVEMAAEGETDFDPVTWGFILTVVTVVCGGGSWWESHKANEMAQYPYDGVLTTEWVSGGWWVRCNACPELEVCNCKTKYHIDVFHETEI